MPYRDPKRMRGTHDWEQLQLAKLRRDYIACVNVCSCECKHGGGSLLSTAQCAVSCMECQAAEATTIV